MAEGQTATILRHIRHLLVTRAARESSDSKLLERFSTHNDEQAFAALLNRHGGLVWGVCRHILRHEQDAEDAFQATFLVLARRAAAIRKRESVGSWLYGVAYRIAKRAKKAAAQRERLEHNAAAQAPRQQSLDFPGEELHALVDEELQRLPANNRLAFILCCLEGRGRREVAGELGWSEGTLASRLARARSALQERLGKKGVTTAVAGAAVISEAYAAAPPALLRSCVNAGIMTGAGKPMSAIGLSSGVMELMQSALQAMLVAKVKTALGVLLLLGLAAGGLGLLAFQPALRPEIGQNEEDEKPNASKPVPVAPVADKQERVDRFGDPLPEEAISRLGTIRLRHGASIYQLLFTLDGKTLISQGGDGVRTWDSCSGKQRHFIRYRDEYADPDPLGERPYFRPLEASFSGDGKLLAMATKSGVRLWSLASGKHLRTVAAGSRWGLCLSRDGKMLATQGKARGTQQRANYEMTVWDTSSGGEVRSWPGKEHLLLSFFTPDGRGLITLERSSAAQPNPKYHIGFRDVHTGKEKWHIDIGDWTPRAVALSPDSQLLACIGHGTGSRFPDSVRTWNVKNGMRIWELDSSTQAKSGLVTRSLRALAFSPNAKILYADGLDGALRALDAVSGRELARVGQDVRYVDALAFSSDGQTLAFCEDTAIRLLDVKTGKDCLDRVGHEWSYVNVAVAAGKVASTDYRQVILWDPRTATALARFRASDDLGAMTLVSGSGRALLRAESDGKGNVRRIWDVATGKELRTIDPAAPLYCVSPDGKIAALARGDGMVTIDLTTGKELHKLAGNYDPVWRAEFTSDGRFLVLCRWDRKIHRYDAATGHKRGEFTFIDDLEPPSPFAGKSSYAVAVSPDGNLIAFGTGYGLIAVHDLASGRLLGNLGKPATSALALNFSPDGRTLAWGGNRDGVIRLMEVATGGERYSFAGHQGGIRSLSFFSDGKTLISGSSDTTALVWDLTGLATTKRQAKPLAQHELSACWQDLAELDAARAYKAMRTLWSRPAEAADYLRAHLHPAEPAEGKQIARLIGDLGSDRFGVRKHAADELTKLGDLGIPACRKALEGQPPLEVRRRLQAILERQVHDRHNPTGDHLRALRAVEVLEMAGGPEPSRILEALARGAPEARLTREAQGSLRRAVGANQGR
jgi:RNA polymerase sigma factor (sigma-70 family)